MAEAQTENFELFSPSKVSDFLRDKVPGISEDVLENVIDHKIDGEVFLDLNDAYLKEIAPLLGDRLKIRRAITSVLAGRSTVSLRMTFNAVFHVLFCYSLHVSQISVPHPQDMMLVVPLRHQEWFLNALRPVGFWIGMYLSILLSHWALQVFSWQ